LTKSLQTQNSDYSSLLQDVAGLLEEARRSSAKSVNSIMTATYWLVGRRISCIDLAGEKRAEYGKETIKQLSADLTARFGRGFGWRNIYQFKQFYENYPDILQTVSAKSMTMLNQAQNLQTLSENSATIKIGDNTILQTPFTIFNMSNLTGLFRLPWSHYVRLLSVKSPTARHFYETEALRGGWSERQLDRQISAMFYERTALSRDKEKMLTAGECIEPDEPITAEEELKSPLILEFLGLKDEYSESDLEEAIIHHLEDFLLELGGNFAFVGRQRRLRIDDVWYRVDLVFFHRKLRCLVLIDLKLGRFTHADSGQMHMYLNYAKDNWTNPGENPPVGLILCAEKGHELAKYALEGLPNKIMAAEYQLLLPDEKLLLAEIEKTRRNIEQRKKL